MTISEAMAGSCGMGGNVANPAPQNDAGEEWQVFHQSTGADILRCGSEDRALEACIHGPYDYNRPEFGSTDYLTDDYLRN